MRHLSLNKSGGKFIVNSQNEKGFHPIYILAGLYSLSIYMFPVIYFAANRKLENENNLNLRQYDPQLSKAS